MLGKYQLSRTQWTGMQEVEVETVAADNTNFSVQVRPSLNGKDLQAPVSPYEVAAAVGSKYRHFLCDLSGVNHSILFKGSFNLVSVQLTVNRIGRD